MKMNDPIHGSMDGGMDSTMNEGMGGGMGGGMGIGRGGGMRGGRGGRGGIERNMANRSQDVSINYKKIMFYFFNWTGVYISRDLLFKWKSIVSHYKL